MKKPGPVRGSELLVRLQIYPHTCPLLTRPLNGVTIGMGMANAFLEFLADKEFRPFKFIGR